MNIMFTAHFSLPFNEQNKASTEAKNNKRSQTKHKVDCGKIRWLINTMKTIMPDVDQTPSKPNNCFCFSSGRSSQNSLFTILNNLVNNFVNVSKMS